MNIDQKINQLLDHSKIHYLFELDNSERLVKKSLKIRLKRIIQILFELDSYTESKWILEDETLVEFQKSLQNAIKGLYIRPSLLHRYVTNVIKYVKLERQLRDHIHPDSFDLNYFYYYKSSRIKLIRAIVYQKFQNLEGSAASDWAMFDLFQSITDDLEDIQEDREQINANRFLFSLANRGQQETIQSYRHFIEFSLQKIPLQDDAVIPRLIATWSQAEAQRILELLEAYQHANLHTRKTELPEAYLRQSSY